MEPDARGKAQGGPGASLEDLRGVQDDMNQCVHDQGGELTLGTHLPTFEKKWVLHADPPRKPCPLVSSIWISPGEKNPPTTPEVFLLETGDQRKR